MCLCLASHTSIPRHRASPVGQPTDMGAASVLSSLTGKHGIALLRKLEEVSPGPRLSLGSVSDVP